MKGIPGVVVSVTNEGVYVQRVATQMLVHVDIDMGMLLKDSGAHAPVYAPRFYKMRLSAPCFGVSVAYPQCAGWHDCVAASVR